MPIDTTSDTGQMRFLVLLIHLFESPLRLSLIALMLEGVGEVLETNSMHLPEWFSSYSTVTKTVPLLRKSVPVPRAMICTR